MGCPKLQVVSEQPVNLGQYNQLLHTILVLFRGVLLGCSLNDGDHRKWWIKAARFHMLKDIAEFDISTIPGLDKPAY